MTRASVRPVMLSDGGGSLIVYSTGSGALTILEDLKSDTRGNSIQNLIDTFSIEVIDLETLVGTNFQSVVQSSLARAKTIAGELYDKMKADAEAMQKLDEDINGSHKVPWSYGSGGR